MLIYCPTIYSTAVVIKLHQSCTDCVTKFFENCAVVVIYRSNHRTQALTYGEITTLEPHDTRSESCVASILFDPPRPPTPSAPPPWLHRISNDNKLVTSSCADCGDYLIDRASCNHHPPPPPPPAVPILSVYAINDEKQFEGERMTSTNERHCVNSVSVKFKKGAIPDGLEEAKVV